MENVPRISWKVIRKKHNRDEIEIEFEGDRNSALEYYIKMSERKMKPGSMIALTDPKGSSINSRHAQITQVDESKIKKIKSRISEFLSLFIVSIFLTFYNLHSNIFVSNISFLGSIIFLLIFTFYLIKFIKNKSKTVYINL